MKIITSLVAVLVNLAFALGSSNGKNVVGYYAPWGGVAVKDVSIHKMTHVNFAFAFAKDFEEPTKLQILPDYLEQAKELVAKAKMVNTTSLISVGGWTGSQTFSIAVRTDSNRKKFIESMLYFIRPVSKGGMGFDGIDLDWEFPGRQGAECKGVSNDTFTDADSTNYLEFLKELRLKVNQEFSTEKKLITAAVRYNGFTNNNDQLFTNAKDYADQFDFINIMTYDFTGGWDSEVQHNTPMTRIESSVQSWLSSGFSASKLNVGLAFYGYTGKSDIAPNASGTLPKGKRIEGRVKGDETDLGEKDEICDEGSIFSGAYKYKYLRADILRKDSVTAETGFVRYFDNESKTPWLYNSGSKTYITYDDPQSLEVKLDYVNKNNLGGAMLWEATNDYNDELINVIVEKLNPHSKSLPKCKPKSP